MKQNMIKKTKLGMTLLCTGITSAILIVMTLTWLLIFEQSLKTNQLLSFKNSMDTFLYSLEQQTVIAHEWLLGIEKNSGFMIRLLDNGEAFVFNERTGSPFRDNLFACAEQSYADAFPETAAESGYPLKASRRAEFTFTYDGTPYYGCMASLARENGTLQILSVSSAAALRDQIVRQRILFAAVDLAAFLALFCFSYFFTGRLLRPIEESRRNQNHFIAAASHELRTPLAALLSCTDAGLRAMPDEKNGFLNTIRTQGLRMSRLVDELLLLSRTDNHTFRLEKKPWEPDTLLLECYEAFEALAAEKNITLSVSLPQEACESCLMDYGRIMQVLGILIHNAISYTPSGGQIGLSLRPNQKSLIYTVSDHGIGIPDTEKSNIFKRFYRVDSSRSREEHFGLGLSIAAEIINAHHGTIQVSDTPGGGSTFTLTLPAA